MESQQNADADHARSAGPPVSHHDAERRAGRATLQLARARAAADLERATVKAHRAMLEQAIAELDRRLAILT